jgi:hypothetical protein
MATKKKIFDAVAASRRWRRKTSRLLREMTSAERIAFLNRRLENWPAAPAAKSPRELARR